MYMIHYYSVNLTFYVNIYCVTAYHYFYPSPTGTRSGFESTSVLQNEVKLKLSSLNAIVTGSIQFTTTVVSAVVFQKDTANCRYTRTSCI